jgi:hypothetical protein
MRWSPRSPSEPHRRPATPAVRRSTLRVHRPREEDSMNGSTEMRVFSGFRPRRWRQAWPRRLRCATRRFANTHIPVASAKSIFTSGWRRPTKTKSAPLRGPYPIRSRTIAARACKSAVRERAPLARDRPQRSRASNRRARALARRARVSHCAKRALPLARWVSPALG